MPLHTMYILKSDQDVYHRPLPGASGWNDIFNSIPASKFDPAIHVECIFTSIREAEAWAIEVGLFDSNGYSDKVFIEQIA